MLNLNTSSRNVQALCDAHYTGVIDNVKLVLQNILGLSEGSKLHGNTKNSIKSANKSLLNQDQSIYQHLKKFANHLLNDENNDLELIIKCKPENFTSLHSRLILSFHFDDKADVKKNNKTFLKKVMHPLLQLIFNYQHLSRGIGSYSAYKLVENIGTNTCPFCNRQYITLVKKGNKRPPLDHFYPRSKYPIFGISFYNLIPTCTQCNTSFKGDKESNTEEFLHPYHEGFSNECHFRYIVGTIEETELKISCSDSKKVKRLENSSSRFEIEEVYKVHKDLAREIYNKSMENSVEYAEHIQRIGKEILPIAPTKEEFYQFYFGNYLKEEEFEKRPLAKFTSDLVHDLRIMELFQ